MFLFKTEFMVSGLRGLSQYLFISALSSFYKIYSSFINDIWILLMKKITRFIPFFHKEESILIFIMIDYAVYYAKLQGIYEILNQF